MVGAAEEGGDLTQATEWARRAVSLRPDVASFRDTLGWVYRASGNLTKAEEETRLAVDMAPRSAESHYHLGVVLADRGKHTEARAAFREALTIEADYAAAREALAAYSTESED